MLIDDGAPWGRRSTCLTMLELETQGNLWGGLLVMMATMVVYLPQIIVLYRSGQSRGVSLESLYLLQAACVTYTSATVMANYPKLGCEEYDQSLLSWRSHASLMVIYNAIVTALISMALCVFCSIYRSSVKHLSSETKKAMGNQLMCKYLVVSILIVVIPPGVLKELESDENTIEITYSMMGLVSCVFTIVQWVPQLRKTIRKEGDVGRLSLRSLLLQIVGSIGMLYYLIKMEHQAFVIWVAYAASLIQMTVLFLYVFYKAVKTNRSTKLIDFFVVYIWKEYSVNVVDQETKCEDNDDDDDEEWFLFSKYCDMECR